MKWLIVDGDRPFIAEETGLSIATIDAVLAAQRRFWLKVAPDLVETAAAMVQDREEPHDDRGGYAP